MSEGPYVMGVDYGTGGVRVGIFDREGTALVFNGVEFDTQHPRPGWAEQDPDEWWSCLVQAVNGAMQQSGVAKEEIAGLSVDATSATVMALDDQGRHLRPAILWMDVRASDQAKQIEETGHSALKYNGYGAVSAEWGIPKAMWLKQNQPEIYNNAATICDCGDYINNRLTGEWAGSVNFASAKYYHDRDTGGFPADMFEQVGIGDFLDKYPQNITDMGVVVGGLRKDVADELGLKEGTPVAQGGIDAYLGAIGLGVVDLGKLALITGSSHVFLGQADKPIHGQGFWGSYTDAMIPGQYTVEAGQASTGTVVAWFKNKFAGDAVAEAKQRGVDPYDVLTEMARQVPPGSDGLIVLDYFQGNRSPYTDPLARGVISNLSLGHGPGHVFRAIIEGICYGTEHILRTLRSHEFDPELTIVSGGPTKSELWMQLHSDISNVPISFTKESEGPVLGSAMEAAVGAGIHPDIQTAAEKMVHTERTLEPDPTRHEEYAFYVDRYVEMFPEIRETMHKTVRHVAAQASAPAAEPAATA